MYFGRQGPAVRSLRTTSSPGDQKIKCDFDFSRSFLTNKCPWTRIAREVTLPWRRQTTISSWVFGNWKFSEGNVHSTCHVLMPKKTKKHQTKNLSFIKLHFELLCHMKILKFKNLIFLHNDNSFTLNPCILWNEICK